MFEMISGDRRLSGLNPEAYLHEVFTRIAKHPTNRIEELLPWNIAHTQPDTIRSAAQNRQGAFSITDCVPCVGDLM